MATNALTELLNDEIRLHFRSAENLSRRAGLAPGTVRNILNSGHAARPTLTKLAPLVRRSITELLVLAGEIPEEPSELGRFELDLLMVAREVEEAEQAAFLVGVRAMLQGLQSLRREGVSPPRPSGEEHPEGGS